MKRVKKAAHTGLILTHLSGLFPPVYLHMNSNCPTAFNHVELAKKGGAKRFYSKCESITQGVKLLLYPSSDKCTLSPPPPTHTHILAHSVTKTCTPMSEQMTEALITVMARWKGEQKLRERSKDGRKMEAIVDHRLSSCPQCQTWQQTERRDNCFVKRWLPSHSFLLTNNVRAPFTTCHSFNLVTVWGALKLLSCTSVHIWAEKMKSPQWHAKYKVVGMSEIFFPDYMFSANL